MKSGPQGQKREDTRSPAQIESDLEATRAEMVQTVGELSYKLDPQRNIELAKSRARGKVQAAKDRVRLAGQNFVHNLKSGDRNTLIGVGIGVAVVTLYVVGKIRKHRG